MPDQTPVTDLSRRARDWAERRHPTEGSPDWFAAKYILDTVPVPTMTLADEIREEGAGRPPGVVKRVNALADRVEAVEKENRDMERELHRSWAERDATYSENNRMCAALATVTDERNNAWDRLADLQDVRDERDEARAEVAAKEDEATRECHRAYRERDEAREKLADKSDEVAQLHTEVERLTRDRTVKYSRTVALPDPADVPEREVWEIDINGVRTVAVRRGHFPELPWVDVYSGSAWPESAVTLVTRLVPDVRRVINKAENLDALPVGSIVIDSEGNPWTFENPAWFRRNLGWGYDGTELLDKYGPVTVIHEEVTA